MNAGKYVGDELGIFARAVAWKGYFGAILRPYIGGNVLEVGAGIGATTAVLCNNKVRLWVCLEPDPEHVRTLAERIEKEDLPPVCRANLGTLQDIDKSDCFDTILYVDVLEHIADDRSEVLCAASRLNANGTLVVLSPAHPWLFTDFDRAIGHYRRYTKASLTALKPAECRLERLLYLDSLGMLLSLGNRLLLKQSMPTMSQIRFWDRWVVPLSRSLDPLLDFSVGKSIVAVWRKSSLSKAASAESESSTG